MTVYVAKAEGLIPPSPSYLCEPIGVNFCEIPNFRCPSFFNLGDGTAFLSKFAISRRGWYSHWCGIISYQHESNVVTIEKLKPLWRNCRRVSTHAHSSEVETIRSCKSMTGKCLLLIPRHQRGLQVSYSQFQSKHPSNNVEERTCVNTWCLSVACHRFRY